MLSDTNQPNPIDYTHPGFVVTDSFILFPSLPLSPPLSPYLPSIITTEQQSAPGRRTVAVVTKDLIRTLKYVHNNYYLYPA